VENSYKLKKTSGWQLLLTDSVNQKIPSQTAFFELLLKALLTQRKCFSEREGRHQFIGISIGRDEAVVKCYKRSW
jgi:hypothetical protein